ncbi:Estradiol 17-beta-dehydrogenase 8 [Aphelenchoides bicaudatus]|nr:Estradiol 17-beta-dehydrogenase 8 [Aphelenchoides bicaudatus]
MSTFGLDGRIAIVTGAARGIGDAIARTLAKNGASVLLIDVLGDQAKKVADELTKEYPSGCFVSIAADLSKRSEVDRVGEHYKQQFTHAPDIVVNNAAICQTGDWIEMEDDEYDSVLAVNLKAVHMVSQYFARLAIEQKRKQTIVNIASFVTYAGHSLLCAYTAAKSGVIGLMKVMAKELGPKGIRVNCKFAEVASKTPMQRIGLPQDVANMVLFLASDLSSFCHGSCYDVHGGYTL